MLKNATFTLALLMTLTSLVKADLVQLKNGDRLTGTVESLADDHLVLKTDYAGPISISWDMISSFSSQKTLQVDLKNGESIQGSIALKESDALSISTASDVVELTRSEIATFGPIPVPEDYSLLENWHGGVNFGYTFSRGNTDLSNLSFSADPSRETSRDRISFLFALLRSKEEGQILGDLYKLQGRYDRFLSENLFLWGRGQFDKDAKADLEYRVREGGGVGYRFRKADHTEFSVTGGVSALQERFLGLDESSSGIGNLGLDMKSTWLAPVSLTAGTIYSPYLEGGRYLAEGYLGVRVPLFGQFNLGLDLVDNYDSLPPSGTKKNDVRLLSTIGWAF